MSRAPPAGTVDGVPVASAGNVSRTPGEVKGMKKISVRKTDSIKLTTVVVGGSYAGC